ncbi:MAG TPA: hypothetical protein VGW38_19080, partial [Chloroflexota bacterium]|nr:hypothetical protein [Chloroflexota bacterium]
GQLRALSLRTHVAAEPYQAPQELFPLRRQSGTRIYVHAKPSILLPDVRVTVGLSPAASPQGAIGSVESAFIKGFRPHAIGKVQAWYYPAEKTVVLWECFLDQHYRTGDDPLADATQVTLWRGVEQSLVRRFSHAKRVMTTWEDLYDRPRWQRFLEVQGYCLVDRAAFIKEVAKR